MRLVLPIVLVLCSACETLTSPAGSVNIAGESDAIQMNSNRRAAYFLRVPDKEGKERLVMVSEPPPDTALQSTVKALAEISSDIKAKTGEAKGSLDVSQTVIQIARATSVMILRDSLFRLAEAYANGAVDSAQFSTQSQGVVAAVIELAKQEVARTEQQAKVDQARAELAKEANTSRRMDLMKSMMSESDPETKSRLLELLEAESK